MRMGLNHATRPPGRDGRRGVKALDGRRGVGGAVLQRHQLLPLIRIRWRGAPSVGTGWGSQRHPCRGRLRFETAAETAVAVVLVAAATHSAGHGSVFGLVRAPPFAHAHRFTGTGVQGTSRQTDRLVQFREGTTVWVARSFG